MVDVSEMLGAFLAEQARGQAAGRPSWQLDMTIEQKLHADRLANSYALSRSEADLRQWYWFRDRFGMRGEEGEKA